MRKLSFDLVTKNGIESITFEVDKVLLIGLAARDTEATKELLAKKKRDGIVTANNVPCIYYVGTSTLTQEDEITVTGNTSSGETEFAIFKRGEKIYIGMGSDHTDRELNLTKIIKSKQVCEKPISKEVWDYDELKDHWDSIKIKSWQVVDGVEIVDQDGTAEELLTVEDLIRESLRENDTVEDAVLFSGTIGLVNGLFYGDAYKCLIEDPVLNRKIEFTYKVRTYEDFE
jgi:hypothetical protein